MNNRVLQPDANEARRLELLRGLALLDTPREDEYDRLIAQLASHIGAPHIALSLVDEHRVWFKARFGAMHRQVTRTGSFCTVAIRAMAPLIVEDAHLDARFSDSPHVRGASLLRSYAGVPLILRGRFAIGTLCVLDQQPRSFSPRDVAVLKATARAVLGRIALQQTLRGLSHAGEDLIFDCESYGGPSRPSSTAWHATAIVPA